MQKPKVKILLVRDYYAQELLAQLRDPKTEGGGIGQQFHSIGLEFSRLLLQKALGAFAPTERMVIETRLAPARCRRIQWNKIHGVYVRRAGACITDALRKMHQGIPIWCIDLHRDETTFKPIEGAHHKLPKKFSPDDLLFLCDPMFATGGTTDWSITRLKELGARNIVYVGWISAPDGLHLIQRRHPDVPIVLGACDEKLNDKAYIVPGFGDAGDLLFGSDNDEFGNPLARAGSGESAEEEETRVRRGAPPVVAGPYSGTSIQQQEQGGGK